MFDTVEFLNFLKLKCERGWILHAVFFIKILVSIFFLFDSVGVILSPPNSY